MKATPLIGSDAPTRSPSTLRYFFWSLVVVITMFSVFVLPFRFPLQVPVFSPVFTAGGNNRVGALAAAAISLLSTVACWRLRICACSIPLRVHDRRPSFALLWAVMAVVVGSAGLLGFLMVRLHVYYADAGYFLTQLRTGMVFHRHLYQGVEFAYGPLLYYWPYTFLRALQPLHVSPEAAYVYALCAMEAVGTAMLFYCVTALPISRRLKVAAFLLLSIITLDPQEGLNYTAFRFLFGVVTLILLSRQRYLPGVAVIATLGAMANFAVSPEIGVSFAASVIAYSTYRALTERSLWLMLIAAQAVGSAVFFRFTGLNYFRTLQEFASGGYNMLLEPAPHIYVLLICAIGLAPIVIASIRAAGVPTEEQASQNGMLLGIYIAGLALLPAAFGRCDPLHVTYNGLPLFLISFVALDRMRRSARRAGLAVALVFFTYSVAQEYALGSGPIRRLITQQPDSGEDVDMARLQRVIRGHQVSFPWQPPMGAADQLTAVGAYHPLYLCVPAVDEAAERRTVEDVRQSEYIMAPNIWDLVTENKINNNGMKFAFRLGYRYKVRRPPFLQGLILTQELRENWQDFGAFGSYELYKKLR